MSVNKVILVGNVGKDPEIRNFDSGNTNASFPLATSEVYKNKDGERVKTTEWHNIVVWGGLTKVVDSYINKGSQLYIEGKINTRKYEKNGETKYITEIRALELRMLDKKSDNQSNSGGGNQQAQDTFDNKESEPNASDDLPF